VREQTRKSEGKGCENCKIPHRENPPQTIGPITSLLREARINGTAAASVFRLQR
jgi:hypothetical protein